jgi:methylase of polypeptide subunit release factors
MQTEKFAPVTDPALPKLFARLEKVDERTAEFRIVICHEPKNARYGAREFPRLTAFIDPSLYVPRNEAMAFVREYALHHLHVGATYLTGQGEYYAD